MRDINRLKEKYELSLDNRHVVGLTVGGLVLVGAVFVLGVTVGKKLAADDRSMAAPDLLSALDQKAAVMADRNADASLTFQEELTKKAPPIQPLGPPPHIPEPERLEPRLAQAAPAVAPVPVPVVVAPAPSPKVVEAPKVQDVIKSVAAKPDEPVATRIARDAGALKDAISRAQRPAEAAADGTWSLQLSAYQDRVEADRFVAGLKDKGYAPFIVEAQVAGKGTWYRVRMGRFASRVAADRYLADFKRETQLQAFVTSAGP
jgi:cell division septation protein DedD